MRRTWPWISGAVLALVMGVALAAYVPEALAFPHRTMVGDVPVYSETAPGLRLDAVMARADRLLAQTPLNAAIPGRRIFLTRGGWRWRLLALRSGDAFALTRPFSTAIVINASDVGADRVTNGRTVGGVRSLSGVVAHETTHILIRRHFGELRSRLIPGWKVEGYADHVAQESGLTVADAAALRRHATRHPALAYYDGRHRVEALLAQGRTVDQIFLQP